MKKCAFSNLGSKLSDCGLAMNRDTSQLYRMSWYALIGSVEGPVELCFGISYCCTVGDSEVNQRTETGIQTLACILCNGSGSSISPVRSSMALYIVLSNSL